MIRIIYLIALIALLLVACQQANDSSHSAYDPPPLLNGLIGETEWAQAAVCELGWTDGEVRMKADSQFVYLCVAPSDTLRTGLDLFIDNLAGEVFMLHVSSAHGQRVLVDSVWQESDWGPAEHWTSNVAEGVYMDGRNVFLAPEAFEFQIERQELLPGDSFKLMLRLKRPELWVPEDADTLNSAQWPAVNIL